MIINQLTSTGSSRLNQIMHTLKHVHHFELSAHEHKNLSETHAHYEGVKKKIVENSAFNSYHTNPEYTKASLIAEAVKLLKEIAPHRQKAVKEGAKPDFMDVDKDGDKKESMKKALQDKKTKVKEAAKPDFLDVDKDGDKKETMKKALQDKKKMNEHRRKIMMEDENLDKAETILAAKDISDKLQRMAEDAAKMAVDKLMPLVDVMKSQFGQEPAEGFNSVVKAQLQSVLDAIIAAKDETDNAVIALQGGQTPALANDISQALPSSEPEGESSDEFGFDQDFSAGPQTAGPEKEPLGRGMKSAMNESKFAVGDLVEFDYAKNMKPVKGKVVEIVTAKKTSNNPHGYMVDVKSGNTIYSLHPDHPKKITEALELTPTEKLKTMAVTGKDDKGRPLTTQQKTAMAKAAEDLSKAKLEEKLNKKMTAGEIIKDFESSEDPKFKGKSKAERKKMALGAYYSMHPKEKRTQEESKINNLKVVVESLKTEFNNLKREFNTHKDHHAQNVMEGIVKDVTQQGYGLEGAAILHKMKQVKHNIQEAQQRLTALVKQVQEHQNITHMTKVKMSALSEQAVKLPYGVIGTATTGVKFKKFFESADHRQLWLDYNQNMIAEQQQINPEDLARIRARLKGTI